MLITAVVALVVASPTEEILPGDLLVAGRGFKDAGGIGHYRASGEYVKAFLGPGELFLGAVPLSGDRVATTRRSPNGVNIWWGDGALSFDFDTNEIRGSGDINVFQDGTLAINDSLDGIVVLYDQDGTYLETLSFGADRLLGGFVDTHDQLWVADPGIGGAVPTVWVLSAEGAVIDSVELSFSPADLVALDDGSFWIADRISGTIRRMNLDGDVLESFDSADVQLFSIGVALDGTILASGNFGTDILRYTTEGEVLQIIAGQHPGVSNSFFTVVPAATCAADCNGDGVLDVLDFVCFQIEWEQQSSQGDCDANGAFDVLDFVCYQVQFQVGCP